MVYARANAKQRRFSMTENKDEAIAVFRFGVICEFVGATRLTKRENGGC
jgi:hypothetical protein